MAFAFLAIFFLRGTLCFKVVEEAFGLGSVDCCADRTIPQVLEHLVRDDEFNTGTVQQIVKNSRLVKRKLTSDICFRLIRMVRKISGDKCDILFCEC